MVKKELSFSGTAQVKVVLRIRPTGDKDRFTKKNDDNCLIPSQDNVYIVPTKQLFTFDHVFGPTTPQCEIFSTIGKDLVSKFIEGKNVTVVAFGQVSSGKSFTMGTAQQTGKFDKSTDGIIPRALMKLFQVLQQKQSYNNAPLFTKSSPTTSTVTPSIQSRLSNVSTPPLTPTPSKSTGTLVHSLSPKYKVKISFINVCKENLIDLLNDAPRSGHASPTINENSKGQSYWTGVNQLVANNVDDALWYLKKGATSRGTGAAGNDDQLSRSHGIFSVTLQQEKWIPLPPSSLFQHQRQDKIPSHQRLQQSRNGQWVKTTSKLHFVDLAKGITSGQVYRRKEGTDIGNIMAALTDIPEHGASIPFGNSLLPRLLKDSIGGDAVTMMVACASPKKKDLWETLNTLQYADWARNIKDTSQTDGAGMRNTSSNLDTEPNHQSKQPLFRTNNETSQFTLSPVSTSSGKSDGYKTTTLERPNEPQNWQYNQQCFITYLQQQIKKLDLKANTSEEHNKLVTTELQHFKNLYQQSCGNQRSNLSFAYLVEPVIEEYEKGMGNLQVENSVLQAAVNYSNTMMNELQSKCDSLQQVVDQHENTIYAMAECQQRIDTNVEYLKTKLDLIRPTFDQVFFDGPKWQKPEIQTHNRESHSSMDHAESSATSLRQDTIGMDPRQQIKDSSARDWPQERESMLDELETLKEKYQALEADRDRWKTQAEHHTELAPKLLDQQVELTTDNVDGSSQLGNIHNNYHEAATELDGTLQRYFEMMDHVEHLEYISIIDTTQPSTTSNYAISNVSPPLSLICNPNTSETGTTSPSTDDHMSDWTVLSPSATDF